jgi:methionyl-tRNA formyltransferase
MNIIFMGTPDFAVPSLNTLLASTHKVVCVVTVPDKPAGRGKVLQSSAIKKAALQARLPVLQPLQLKDASFIRDLQSFQPDLIVVVAFRILPPEVFTLPRKGTVNLHASLLPRYRGAAPIQWALINGEHETGVTTFFIEEKVDTGNVIMQRRVPVGADMNAGELHDILATLGAQVLFETVDCIAEGTCVPLKQVGDVTLAPKITRELCCIDWKKSAFDIHNIIRALSPIPGAVTMLHGKSLKVLASRMADKPDSSEPGTVVNVGKNDPIDVQTGRGIISLLKIQPEGKRVMSCEEYVRGYPVHGGDKFHQCPI